MSNTVVLVGYSASGKSHFGEKVKKRFASAGKPLDYRDSDEEIGGRCGEGIFSCYISMGYKAAITHIEAEERSFLSSLNPTTDPRLIVTGPNVPLREPEWGEFLKRVKPTVYYFDVSPGMSRSRLADRENNILRDHPELKDHPEFGSWNNGTLRDHDATAGKYVSVEVEVAKDRIASMMTAQKGAYEKAVSSGRKYECKDLTSNGAKRDLVRAIEADL